MSGADAETAPTGRQAGALRRCRDGSCQNARRCRRARGGDPRRVHPQPRSTNRSEHWLGCTWDRSVRQSGISCAQRDPGGAVSMGVPPEVPSRAAPSRPRTRGATTGGRSWARRAPLIHGQMGLEVRDATRHSTRGPRRLRSRALLDSTDIQHEVAAASEVHPAPQVRRLRRLISASRWAAIVTWRRVPAQAPAPRASRRAHNSGRHLTDTR